MNQWQLPDRNLFSNRRENTLGSNRKKLPWPSNRPFKILSLDGGGIRGVYGAKILTQVEEQITGDRPIADYFDMIAGTSTGGIIGLGLGMGITARKISELYYEKGKRIFLQKWWWRIPLLGRLLKLLAHALGPIYDHKALEEFLQDEFQEAKLGEAKTRMIIPAFINSEAEIQISVFKTDHHPDFSNDFKSFACDIARATSAAPTYLEGHTQGSSMFLDGGLWANNPVMVAIIDALSCYDLAPHQIQVLSISSGNSPLGMSLKHSKGGFLSWRTVIETSMFLTTNNAHSQARLLLGPQNILRLEPTQENANIKLDDWKMATERLPLNALDTFNDRKEIIEKFFNTTVNPRHRFHTSEVS